MALEFRGVWFDGELPGSNEGTDLRRALRISVEAGFPLDLVERAIVASFPGFGLGMRDNAEGDFFVGSSKTQVEKLAKEYDA